MTLISIDVETGGLDPSLHALLSVGIAQLDTDFQPVRIERWLVLPSMIWNRDFEDRETGIDPEALKYNGYSREKWLARGALDLNTAMTQIAAWLPADPEPIAHGAPFDRPFLEAAERRSGVKLGLGHRWRCSHALAYGARDAVGLQFKSASLDCLAVMCGHWKEGERPPAHDALDDAVACAAVYRWLLRVLRTCGDH